MAAILLFATAVAGAKNYGYVRNPLLDAVDALPRLRSAHGKAALPASFDWRNVQGVNYAVADVQQHAPVYCARARTCLCDSVHRSTVRARARPCVLLTDLMSASPLCSTGGSCWVHAVVAMLNDRLKIARRAAFPDVMLARQVLVNCAPKTVDGAGLVVGFNGCDGGDERDIYESLLRRDNWLPDETCQPYEAVNRSCDVRHTCNNCMPTADGGSSCFAVPRYVSYGVSEWHPVTGPGMGAPEREEAIRAEIFAHGPVVCNFAAIPEFDDNYTLVARRHGGVFRTDANVTADDINHDIVLSGWGVTPAGLKYWIGRNSWGTFWGDNGWFRIERGVNALLVEGACSAATPTHEALDDALDGLQGGGPLGLEDVGPKVARWSHRPRSSKAPPFLAAENPDSATLVQLAADKSGAAPAASTLVPPVGALALAAALAISAYAAGAAATRRRVRLEASSPPEADGLRTAMLRDAQE